MLNRGGKRYTFDEFVRKHEVKQFREGHVVYSEKGGRELIEKIMREHPTWECENLGTIGVGLEGYPVPQQVQCTERVWVPDEESAMRYHFMDKKFKK